MERVSTKNHVMVGNRKQLQKDVWFVEWSAENRSADLVEQFTKSQMDFWTDKSQKIEKGKTLGSEIQSVEFNLELHPVSEIIRKIWDYRFDARIVHG